MVPTAQSMQPGKEGGGREGTSNLWCLLHNVCSQGRVTSKLTKIMHMHSLVCQELLGYALGRGRQVTCGAHCTVQQPGKGHKYINSDKDKRYTVCIQHTLYLRVARLQCIYLQLKGAVSLLWACDKKSLLHDHPYCCWLQCK